MFDIFSMKFTLTKHITDTCRVYMLYGGLITAQVLIWGRLDEKKKGAALHYGGKCTGRSRVLAQDMVM